MNILLKILITAILMILGFGLILSGFIYGLSEGKQTRDWLLHF